MQKTSKLKEYLNNLDKDIKRKNHRKLDKVNADIIREFIYSYEAMPSNPGEKRLITLANRLKTIALIVKKPLTGLNEEDIKNINRTLKDYESVSDYRKSLKSFWKITDKKKYIDLIDSEFMLNKGRQDKVFVDPEKFFNKEESERYLRESIRHSKRQQCFAGLWLTTGMRPREYLILNKSMFQFQDNNVIIRLPRVKTKARIIVISGKEATGLKENLEPYFETISNNNERLFKIGWAGLNKAHKLICSKAKIKDKDLTMYNGRKMTLTRWYNTMGLVKAAQMSGHTPGSKAMKHYVALSEEQLIVNKPIIIETKTCPNPNCAKENSAHLSHCKHCQAPLDRDAFAGLFTKQILEILKQQTNLTISNIKKK